MPTQVQILTYLFQVLMYLSIFFPIFRTPNLQTSMYESGKSRADLWAFAAIVAVEFGVETNNGVCDGSFDQLREMGKYKLALKK